MLTEVGQVHGLWQLRDTSTTGLGTLPAKYSTSKGRRSEQRKQAANAVSLLQQA
jgi:hypothetical protein